MPARVLPQLGLPDVPDAISGMMQLRGQYSERHWVVQDTFPNVAHEVTKAAQPRRSINGNEEELTVVLRYGNRVPMELTVKVTSRPCGNTDLVMHSKRLWWL